MSRAVGVTVTCPCCGHEITASYLPGEAPQTYGPPEHCHPGAPDDWEDPKGCECVEYLTDEDARRYEDDMMERVRDAADAAWCDRADREDADRFEELRERVR